MDENWDVFAKKDLSGYAEEWVWICHGEIIAHGKDIPDIDDHRKRCRDIPLLAPVCDYDNFIGGGLWNTSICRTEKEKEINQ